MNIAISGVTGFIGSHLSTYFHNKGHRIVHLNREMFTDSMKQQLQDVISKCDIVINLAGAPINRKWDSSYKKILYESRIHTTRSIVEAIKQLDCVTRLLISASAVGYYPNDGCYDEYSNEKGDEFLSQLCDEWEKEAQKVPDPVRCVITRFGIVLSPEGGALKQMLPPFKMKIATTIGPGNQPFCWIDLDDLVRAMDFIINNKNLRGIFNFVAPQKINNSQFANELGKHYHTFIKMTVPTFVFKIIYGEGSKFLTIGQCVTPTRLLESGFLFETEKIGDFIKKLRL